LISDHVDNVPTTTITFQERARALLSNVSDRLHAGGVFFATIPDANVIVWENPPSLLI
jgi:hypothetical protein